MGTSPAFSFYAKDFLTGTATMSLAEVGAYVKFLCYQWDAGAVPKSSTERARVLGCTPTHERNLWLRLSAKFVLVEAGYQNTRLEVERQKQIERRQKLAENGSKGGSQKVANATERLLAKEQQLGGQNPSLSSSSSSSFSDSKEQKAAAAPLIMSPALYEERRKFCAFVGSKIEVPNGLHAELRKGHGGHDPEKELQSWYLQLNETAEIDAWRIPRGKDFYPWFKSLYGQKFPAPSLSGDKSFDEQIDEWARS